MKSDLTHTFSFVLVHFDLLESQGQIGITSVCCCHLAESYLVPLYETLYLIIFYHIYRYEIRFDTYILCMRPYMCHFFITCIGMISDLTHTLSSVLINFDFFLSHTQICILLSSCTYSPALHRLSHIQIKITCKGMKSDVTLLLLQSISTSYTNFFTWCLFMGLLYTSNSDHMFDYDIIFDT